MIDNHIAPKLVWLHGVNLKLESLGPSELSKGSHEMPLLFVLRGLNNEGNLRLIKRSDAGLVNDDGYLKLAYLAAIEIEREQVLLPALK